MPDPIYATVPDLREYAADRTLPSDAVLTQALLSAQDDIDSLWASSPFLSNGRKLNVAHLTSSEEDALIRATCIQALWRLTKGPAYFEQDQGTIQGPDYTVTGGSFHLLAFEASRTLRGAGFLRSFARGRA